MMMSDGAGYNGSLQWEGFSVPLRRSPTVEIGADMGKGKDKPAKQTKKPKSDKPKGAGSAYQQDKASGRK